MNKYRNEQGVALVLTMFIITILLLFISAQFFQVTNTRQQVSTMEKHIMAEHMAEMGVDYYRALIESIEHDATDQIKEYITKIKTVKEDVLHQTITSTEKQGNRSYLIDKITISEPSDESGAIEISFNSTGTAYEKSKTINSTITINIAVDGN